MTSASSAPRTVLITGASRGIGAACARACARDGWAVAVHYRREAAAAQALVAELRGLGVAAESFAAEVADEAAVAALFEAVDRRLPPLGALVNNAGIVDVAARVDEMSAARVRRMFEVNVVGAFVCAAEAVRRLSTRHGGAGGAIVNVGSAASRLGSPAQYVDYAASKGALDTFTIGLAREVAAEGVRVNAVRPGIIDTDIHASGGLPDRARQLAPTIPMQRPGRADEVATAICWLASDEASYATGAILDVSGGR